MDVSPAPWFYAFSRVFLAELTACDPYPADPNHPHRVDPWRFVSTSLHPRGTISWYKFRFNPRYMLRVFTIATPPYDLPRHLRSLPIDSWDRCRLRSQYRRVYFDRLTGRSDINFRMLANRLDLENERDDENLGPT